MQTMLLGNLLDCTDDPAVAGEAAIRYLEDGALLFDEGHIIARGSKADVMKQAGDEVLTIDHSGRFVVPGLIDTHLHYPQSEMIAAYGEQLLTWLTEHAFPTEKQFADKAHARGVADFFLRELLRNGTTTAMVFGTVHPESVDAFFEQAQRLNLRMICGKVMMDRHCPQYLQDTAESSYQQSKALIAKWHGIARLSYAVTPRFAPTSSPQQLAAAAQLMSEHPDIYLQTHVAENTDECRWAAELFPQATDYVGVYEDAGLLGRRSVLAHGIYLTAREQAALAEHEASIAHCPTSNLFIGSGLFDMQSLRHQGIRIGLASDVGGGSSFSLLQTFNEAYKVQQLQNRNLSAFDGLYLATLGGARVLDMDTKIGRLEVGYEADCVVLDPAATELLRFRLRHADDLHHILFALLLLGDDRVVAETFAYGRSVHQRTY